MGLRDAKVSEKLQTDSELTLEKAVILARQNEAIKQQQLNLRDSSSQSGATNSVNVDAIKKTYRQRPQPRTSQSQMANNSVCSRCGKSPSHSKDRCPAREATCRKCNKKGHFRVVCKSKVPRNAVGEIEEEDDAFLGAIADTDSSEPWTVTLFLNERQLLFKIDTGADVTAIPETTYIKSRDGPLHKSNRVLKGPSEQKLHVKGYIEATLTRNLVRIDEKIYVVSGLQNALVGRPAIQALNLVARLDAVNNNPKQQVIQKFPELFTGLGTMQGEYQIKLKADATPFVLTTPRRIAVPLQPKVKAELQRMEKLGVIRKVEEPTEWCSGIVVVPKPNGNVRVCVDLTKLNESVCRERHILPSVEETLAQLSNAKVFSKLDANSGFWQVKLDNASSLLTTFITPYGRYCFNCLPFGITSAPEYFQKQMAVMLAGAEGVVCLMDDILVYGKDEEEHQKHLEAVMHRLKKAKITLNVDKCHFAQSTIKFLGQIVNQDGIQPDPEKVRAVTAMPPPTNVQEVRRFMGMVNQLSKFCPQLADKAKPINDLLSSKNDWNWGDSQ